MLNLKKEADKLQIGELQLGECPVCHACVSHIYFMQNADTKISSKWFSCACGIVWQAKPPTEIYDQKYLDKFKICDQKTIDDYQYPVKIYAPIIEELVYGRKALLVGWNPEFQTDEFLRRGWVARTIHDFENTKFKESEKYNLIWLYSSLETLKDPIASLKLCHKILAEDGILFIASPDTDFISTRSSSNFIHWKPETNHIMWNRRSITRYLENLGFNVIFNRQNYEHRFPAWDDFHVLAQKKFF
jgi:predicted SAM-dependent methyltransferase